MKKRLFLFVLLLTIGFTMRAQTPVPMQSQPGLTYTENFADIANWTNNFASGIGANRFLGILVGGTGTIPDPVIITQNATGGVGTTTFQTTGSSGGVQRGSLTGNPAGTIVLLSTGTSDNSSSTAIDFFMDFTGVNAGVLSFDATTVFNGTGDRRGSLRVYSTTDGITFTELTGGGLPYIATNNVSGSAAISVSLPVAFNGSATARLRFYYHNGGVPAGTFGSRPKISIDNLTVTALSAGPPPYIGAPSGVVDGTTYSDVTFTSGGSFPAGANITANGNLSLNDNVVNLNGGSITVSATSTVSPGAGNLGRVFGGNFIHNVAAVTGTKVFPLGTATARRYAVVNFTTAPTVAGTLTGFSAEGNAPSQNFGSVTPVGVTAPFFWTIDAAFLSGGTYNLNLTADNVPGVSNASALRILKRPTGGGPWIIQGTFGTSTFSAGTVAIGYTGLSGFSEFAIGSNPVDNPLPVELSSFTGNATQNGVRLAWMTQSELNNAGFVLTRSSSSRNEQATPFVEVASYRFLPELRGKGTTTSATNYSFLDGGVEMGKSYTYRLRSFDLDGTVHDYAQTVSVEVREPVQAQRFDYNLSQNFPNPFNPSTSIKYSVAQSGNVSLKVYDLLGREVMTLVNQVQPAGEYQLSFDASGLAASGVYIYRLQSGSFTRTMKMLMVK